MEHWSLSLWMSVLFVVHLWMGLVLRGAAFWLAAVLDILLLMILPSANPRIMEAVMSVTMVPLAIVVVGPLVVGTAVGGIAIGMVIRQARWDSVAKLFCAIGLSTLIIA